MSIFYDPLKRKPRVWVFAMFIVIPIVLIILSLFGTRTIVKKDKMKAKKEDVDIFNKF